MPKVLCSKFQSRSIKIEDFKINPINLLTLSTPREGVTILNLLLGMSYNTPKMLCSEFQSRSIKIEDFCRDRVSEGKLDLQSIKIKDFKINPINPFNPISTKKESGNVELENFKLIMRNVL